MLPKKIRESLFEKASVKTMRYVTATPVRKAVGLAKRVYTMIADDFFVNGSLSSHSQVPDLFAGTWLGGREIVLVTDRVDRRTKEAMGAALSYMNDCPYCADMLVSLVHGAGDHRTASSLLRASEESILDPVLRSRLTWVRNVLNQEHNASGRPPFAPEEFPEAIGTLFVLSYVNRFSHVVMDGSPVGDRLKGTALRLFGHELREATGRRLEKGRAIGLLPAAPVPGDMDWTLPNPRIAEALARWSAAVHREAAKALSPEVRALVQQNLAAWSGETMPISRSWVDPEVAELEGVDRDIAKLVLVVAKASWQFDPSLVNAVMGTRIDEKNLIRILAFASFSAARRLAQLVGEKLKTSGIAA